MYYVYDGDTIQVVFPLQQNCFVGRVDYQELTTEIRTRNNIEKQFGYDVRNNLERKY